MSPLRLRGFVIIAVGRSLLAPHDCAHARESVADTSRFRPLDLPTPNEYRSGSGRPGPKYWQQRVDYRIAATLDPEKNEIRGRETIHYVNRSPDSLPYLWMHVERSEEHTSELQSLRHLVC